MKNKINIGLYEADITPYENVWLVGYSNRYHKSRGVYKKIKAGAIYLNNGENEYLVITADIIGFSSSFTASLKSDLSIILGIKRDNIVLTASHTHCAPYFWKWNMPGYVDYKYREYLHKSILDISLKAKKNKFIGKLYYSKTKSNFGVNRRKVINGIAEFKPNPEGPIDRDLFTIIFKNLNDSIMGTWTIYGCHPTSLGGYLIGPDYPGYLKTSISEYTKSYAFFSTGCAGDIRPWFKNYKKNNNELSRGHQGIGTFNRPTFQELESESKKIANEVISSINKHEKISLNKINLKTILNDLDYDSLPSKKQLKCVLNGDTNFLNVTKTNKYYKIWAKHFLYHINLAELPKICEQEIQVLSFENLNIVFLAGEVLTEIGMNIKKELNSKETITIAYSNGLIGYIAGSNTYKYGGYELDKSYPLYLRPSKFSINSEDKIINNIKNII